jgi:thrombospondin type 3 repeat protein
MKIKMTLLSLGGAATIAAGTVVVQSADMQPLIVSGMTGTLRIQQGVPCDDDVDRTVPVTSGRLTLTPSEGIPLSGGNRMWTLATGTVTFGGFSVSRSCLGFSETRTYGDIHVQISRAVTFTATPTPTPGIYNVVIPKANFVITYVTTVNGSTEIGTKQPKQDVTGTINMADGTMQMRVVLGTRVTFKAGCVEYLGCVINETRDGTQTANLAGTMEFPDVDGDGVPDRSDNCKYTANPTQAPVATPTITPPPATTLNSCLSRAFGRAAAADVCDARAVSVTNNAPTQFNLGANVVTWFATDWMSRVASATQSVTIVDTTPPTFTSVPPDVFMANCGPASLGTPTATDDCAGAPTFSNNAPPIFYVGVTPVTWTATDVSGNNRTALQNVTVVDTVPPTVTCVATNPTGSSFRVSATDACLGAPVIRLGSYVLNEGEVIMINETGQPGIRLKNDISSGGIRHFQVGRGEAIISATDASSNVATVACPVR